MAQKENIDILLLYIHKLDEIVTNMRGTEIYPASFFDQTMDLTSKIMDELHSMEAKQIEALQKQLEAHQALLQLVTRKSRTVAPVIKEQDEVVQTISQLETTVIPTVSSTPNTTVKGEKIEQTTTPLPTKEEIIPPTPETDVEKAEAEPATKNKPTETADPIQVHQTQTKPSSTATEQRQGLFLNDILEKKNLSDFKKAFSLNDRFRFRRELFCNNEKEMELVINKLNSIQSYEESINYLNNKLKWDMENQAVKDFILLLERRFL